MEKVGEGKGTLKQRGAGLAGEGEMEILGLQALRRSLLSVLGVTGIGEILGGSKGVGLN